jgi:dihydroorotase
MNVLIKRARIFGQKEGSESQEKDILIRNGIIESLEDNIIADDAKLIQETGICVSSGWLDIFTHLEDPGNDHRETIHTGAASGAAGGFTDLMLLPNTSPAIDSRSQIEYFRSKSSAIIPNLHPIGSISKGNMGKELAEMYDMQGSGAKAFSDGLKPLQHAGLMLKALQYVAAVRSILIQIPDDQSISPDGLMHEGVTSTRMGLPGKPALTEELMIARDIELLKYSNSRLHITGISSARSVEMIHVAKNQGLDISCSVTPYHLYFRDEDLNQYDTNLKVNPPLRTESDRLALIQGLREGVIDCISSHHLPRHHDEKECEFQLAEAGMSGLETAYAASNHILQDNRKLVNLLCYGPRKIFNLPAPEIEPGQPALLTIFNPDAVFVQERSSVKSKSFNNAFIGKQLKGKVIGIINGNKTDFNQ